jgi:hypothetical protein
MSANLSSIRERFPQYKDVDDATLADALYRKHYSDVPRDEFNRRIGLAPVVEPDKAAIEAVISPLSAGPGGETVRANAAGNTRSQMPLPDIQRAYRVAQERGDRPEQRAMAEAYVERERRDSPVIMGVGDRVRTVARGVPFVGEYLDEASALTSGMFDPKMREEVRDYQRARDRSFDAANPNQAMVAKAIGGIGGTIAAIPYASAVKGGQMALGVGAKSVPGAIGRGLVAGALQGGAGGYGRADETQDAGKMAATDAAIGAAFGGVVPAALATGKAAWDKLAAMVTPNDVLDSVPKAARKFFVDQFGKRADVAALRGKLDELGPNAVLADVSPEMLGIAQGASSRPSSRQAVVDALTARDAGKSTRLAQATNETLGPVVEPSRINRAIAENMDEVGNQYGDVIRRNAQAVDTKRIADELDTLAVDLRGPAQKVVREIRSDLNIPGTKELDPSPGALWQTRQSIDGKMRTETDPKALGQLQAARDRIDAELASSVPGIKQVDGRFEELARQRDGLKEGATIFRSGPEAVRPADFAERIAAAPQPKGLTIGPSAEPLRLSQGARAEIDRIVGSNSNDVAAMRQLLKGEGDWNRDKLRMTFGADKADRLLRVLDAEGVMESTFRQVVGGSQTGVKEGFRTFIDDASKGVNVPAEASGVGLLLRGGKKVLERVTGSNNEAKAEQFADELARLSVAGGSEAQAIIAAVLKRQSRAANDLSFNDFAGRLGAGAGRADDPMGMKSAVVLSLMARDRARQEAEARRR